MFLIIDGTNLGHRAYHAMKSSETGIPVTKTNRPIAGCTILLKQLPRLIRDLQATRVAVVFDNQEPTFRHRLFAEYKGKRAEKDEQLKQDLQLLLETLESLGIGIVAPIGYEADDLIATLSVQPVGKKMIYSSDQDLFQLIDADTRVLLPGGAGIIMDPCSVCTKTGLKSPRQIADYKAMSGDSSDNIPGVYGIGKARTVELLNRYADVEAIYAHMGEITGTVYTRLREGEDQARLCLQLTTLVRDAPMRFGIDRFAVKNFNLPAFTTRMESLGLKTIASQYNLENLFPKS